MNRMQRKIASILERGTVNRKVKMIVHDPSPDSYEGLNDPMTRVKFSERDYSIVRCRKCKTFQWAMCWEEMGVCSGCRIRGNKYKEVIRP